MIEGGTHKGTGKNYLFHKKSNAWRIMRDWGLVNRQGCSPLETIEFKTEQALLEYLDNQEIEQIKALNPDDFAKFWSFGSKQAQERFNQGFFGGLKNEK